MKKMAFFAGCLVASFQAMALASAPGDLDESFVPESNYTDVFYGLEIQPDGNILVVGRENTTSPIMGVIYRLNTNGVSDSTFLSGPNAYCSDNTIPKINTIGFYTNQSPKILLGGAFTFYNDGVNDVSRPRLAQLDSGGSLDTTFAPSASGEVFTSAIQPDGMILLGGNFANFQASGQSYIVRIKPDGTVDTNFNTGISPNGAVRAVALQPDGKILIGGDFTTVSNTTHQYIARLNTNGTIDTSFTSAPDNSVYAIAVQPSDKKILIGGYLLNVDGTACNRIARLNPDGTLDTNFTAGCDSMVWALAIQQNGKILAGGRFNNVEGRKKIVRFTTSGTVDTNFSATVGAGTGTSDEIRAIKIQADGRIVIAGKFTTFNSQSRFGIARLHGDPVVQPSGRPVIRSVAPNPAVSADLNSTVTFTAQTEGDQPITYYWYFNNQFTDPVQLLVSTTASTLTVPNIGMTNFGTYTLVASNAAGNSSTNFTLSSTTNTGSLTVDRHQTVFVNPSLSNQFVLQASTNLADTQGWKPVGTNTGVYADTNKYPQVFFRVRL